METIFHRDSGNTKHTLVHNRFTIGALGQLLCKQTKTTCRNKKTNLIKFCSFVSSILEYFSQIWNPRYEVYIPRLKNVQKKFIIFLCNRIKDCTILQTILISVRSIISYHLQCVTVSVTLCI